MKATLFRRVHVLDLDLESGMTPVQDVLVLGDRIAEVGPEAASRAPEGCVIVDGLSRHLLAPGLINAHFHSSANHMKGLLPSLPLELFMLYESPEIPDLAPSPREAYLRTMLGGLEMVRSGTTAVQDDAFFVPQPETEVIDAVFEAYRDLGIRATVAIDQPQLPEAEKFPFLSERAPARLRRYLQEPPSVTRERMLELNRWLIDTWHGAHGGRLRAAVSISAPQRVSPEYFADLEELSRRHGLPLFAHMLETKVQRVLAQEQPRFAGRSLVQYTADLGLLNDRTNVIHAVWVDDEDLALIAEHGATIAHNPISNLRLGSGIMPFAAVRDHGIPIALGSDEAITDDAVNLWAVAKAAGLIHNITGEDPGRWPSARAVLHCLFEGGARAMLPGTELGVVRRGALADLILIDLQSLAFTPLNDLARQLVYCENGTSVRLTMVAGRIIAEHGKVLTVDEASLLAESRELFAERMPALKAAAARAADLDPYYRDMVGNAAERDVGFTRWVNS